MELHHPLQTTLPGANWRGVRLVPGCGPTKCISGIQDRRQGPPVRAVIAKRGLTVYPVDDAALNRDGHLRRAVAAIMHPG